MLFIFRMLDRLIWEKLQKIPVHWDMVYIALKIVAKMLLNLQRGFHTDSAQVIYFNFVSNNDYILDLRDSEDLKLFNEWINDDKRSRLFNELRKKYSNNGHQKSLDGAILELYIYDLVKRFKYVTKLDAVVANTHTYFNDSASKITTFPNGVEVCIRNLDGIDLESLNVYN